MAATVEEIRKPVDLQSYELSRKTHQAILYTWLVIGFGLVATFALALFIMQGEVVRELFSLRDSIQDLAAGKLDQPIPYLDRSQVLRSEEHTSELQSHLNIVCRLLLVKKHTII